MGGNALLLSKAERMNNEEFEIIKNEISELFDKSSYRFGLKEIYFVKNYSEKDSHGDVDVLCFYDNYPDKLLKEIEIFFNPEEVHKNDNVISFNFRSHIITKNVQVDLITYNTKFSETAKLFHNYNDLGNFIGKISKGIGLKFSPKGLLFDLKCFTDSSISFQKNLELSIDVDKILDVLGLDKLIYRQGFENLEEIYDFITKSKNFIYETFSHKQNDFTNSQQRHRDIRRPSFLYFSDVYIKKHPELRTRTNKKPSYLESIYFISKEFNIDVLNIQMGYERKLYLKLLANSKFNANDVIDVFDISGHELGNSLKKFHKYFNSSDERLKYIIDNDKQTILKLFGDLNGFNI